MLLGWIYNTFMLAKVRKVLIVTKTLIVFFIYRLYRSRYLMAL